MDDLRPFPLPVGDERHERERIREMYRGNRSQGTDGASGRTGHSVRTDSDREQFRRGTARPGKGRHGRRVLFFRGMPGRFQSVGSAGKRSGKGGGSSIAGRAVAEHGDGKLPLGHPVAGADGVRKKTGRGKNESGTRACPGAGNQTGEAQRRFSRNGQKATDLSGALPRVGFAGEGNLPGRRYASAYLLPLSERARHPAEPEKKRCRGRTAVRDGVPERKFGRVCRPKQPPGDFCL